MDKRIKRKWVKALQSGRYQQTQATLRDKTGFCCLGVLCDLHRRETNGGEWQKEEADYYYITPYESEELVLPEPVRSWAALPASPDVDGLELTDLNDSGLDFPMIAALIEHSDL